MVAYFALQSTTVHDGGFADCLLWSRKQVQSGPGQIKILRARAGEKHARAIAEIASDGERLISHGRCILVSKLRK